jgi:uncharacterized protein YbjT (DUF2867 family)
VRVLITGANGFVAKAIIRLLHTQGHTVVTCGRSSSCEVFADFNMDTTEAVWLPRLKSIDAVINCVGVFQVRDAKKMWRIHADTPTALFRACVTVGVKKVVQISALGIDKTPTPYSESKLAADTFLQTLPLDAVILRPSFIFGQDCYGGSAFFRGLAGMFGVLCLPGAAQQKLQPILLDELAQVVATSLTLKGQVLLHVAGKERLSLKDILNTYRRWLGFKAAPNVSIPLWILKITAKAGDFFYNSPISTTGMKMSEHDNVITDADFKALTKAVGFEPAGFTAALERIPSHVQDRWHARLFLLRPALRVALAFVWIFTGVVSICNAQAGYALLSHMGFSTSVQPVLLYGASVLDIVLGLATLANVKLLWVGSIQCVLMVAYALLTLLLWPQLWAQPLGPIIKNMPLIVATLIMMALERTR